MTATGGIRMKRLLQSGKVRSIRGGLTLDLYNQAVIPKLCCTVTTRIDASNHYWLMTMRRISPTITLADVRSRKKGVIYTDPRTGYKYRIAIRKYTPRDCFRLMGVRDEDFDKLLATDDNGKRLISNSKLYQLAGNSIVTDCMTAMFDSLFYPTGQHQVDKNGQLSLF